MGAELKRLSELIPGWPEGAPDRGDELVQADPSALATLGDGELVRQLRSHMTLALQSARSITFASPLEVKRRLELGHVYPKARKWDTLALDANRHRVMVPSPAFGGVSPQRYVSLKVPSPEVLMRKMALPEGGRYLIIYGGGPAILSVRDKRGGGVADDLAVLHAAVPLADVVFWQIRKDEPPTLYSLSAGIGDCAGEAVAFPDLHFLDVARGRVHPGTTPAPSTQRLERAATETGGTP